MHKNKNVLLEELTQKQLKEDFQVYQYLRENKQKTNNIDNYIKFYNQILIKKNDKQHKCKLLLYKYQQLQQSQTKNIQISRVHLPNLKQNYDNQFDKIWVKVTQQLQIRDNLQRQIVEYKKSLGLLKGDIGHIIQRNQSQKLLQSKINKVKIVADDQFNKVYHQFSKDKQQQKILSSMQKGFNSRLKNLENFEHKSLAKTEQTFLEVTHKQKKMNEKLINIQKNGALVQQYVELKKQKLHNNYTIQYLNTLLTTLQSFLNCQESAFILSFQQKNNPISKLNTNFQKLANKQSFIFQKLNEIHKQKINLCQQTQSHLIFNPEIVDKILAKYDTLNLKLHSLSQLYSQYLLKLKNLKLVQVNDQQNYDFETDQYNLNHQNKSNQIRDSKIRLQKNLRVIFVCLNFFKSMSKNQKFDYLLQRTVQQLVALQDSNQQICYYQFLPESVNINFQEIKKNFKQKLESCSKHTYSRSKKSTHHTVESNGEDEDVEIIQKNSKKQLIKINNQIEEIESCKAKRIQFLQNIDQQYYKMLKETLKMQKDHTRKNYDFLRRFKRQKYVNRDNILKQKRYQATFSILWSQHQKKSSPVTKNSFHLTKTANTSLHKTYNKQQQLNHTSQTFTKSNLKHHLRQSSSSSNIYKKKYQTILEIIHKL